MHVLLISISTTIPLIYVVWTLFTFLFQFIWWCTFFNTQIPPFLVKLWLIFILITFIDPKNSVIIYFKILNIVCCRNKNVTDHTKPIATEKVTSTTKIIIASILSLIQIYLFNFNRWCLFDGDKSFLVDTSVLILWIIRHLMIIFIYIDIIFTETKPL